MTHPTPSAAPTPGVENDVPASDVLQLRDDESRQRVASSTAAQECQQDSVLRADQDAGGGKQEGVEEEGGKTAGCLESAGESKSGGEYVMVPGQGRQVWCGGLAVDVHTDVGRTWSHGSASRDGDGDKDIREGVGVTGQCDSTGTDCQGISHPPETRRPAISAAAILAICAKINQE